MSVNKVSVVVSIYNEEESVEKFYDVCSKELKNTGRDYELIFVNDGSIDNSYTLLDNIAKNGNIRRYLFL